MKKKHFAFGCTILIIFIIMVYVALVYLLSPLPICSDYSIEILLESRAPDGKNIATSFISGGNATVGFSTRVCLRSGNSDFDSDEGIVFIKSGIEPIELQWQTPTHLNIEYKGNEIFKKEKSWKNISLHYQKIE